MRHIVALKDVIKRRWSWRCCCCCCSCCYSDGQWCG